MESSIHPSMAAARTFHWARSISRYHGTVGVALNGGSFGDSTSPRPAVPIKRQQDRGGRLGRPGDEVEGGPGRQDARPGRRPPGPRPQPPRPRGLGTRLPPARRDGGAARRVDVQAEGRSVTRKRGDEESEMPEETRP